MSGESSFPIKLPGRTDNVAISKEAESVNKMIKEMARMARENGYEPYRVNNKRDLSEYLAIGINDARENRIGHHSELDLRNGKAT